MNSKIQDYSAASINQDPGYPQQTTPQEALSQPERITGNNPYEINPNAPKTGNNPNEINPQPGKSPNEIRPNTPHRENTPNEISPQTGNNPNEINPNGPQTNDPNEIQPNSPQTIGEKEDDNRQPRELELPENGTEKKDGYAEQPSEDYIPEINGNEKYQQNYQDNEEPGITE